MQVIYVDNSTSMTVLMTPQEAIQATRLFGNGETRLINEHLSDWLRIHYARMTSQDVEQVQNRLSTATAVELAAVMLALQVGPRKS